MTHPTSAESQVRFLRDLQRILEEGVFTASYKFALVHAIADLCIRRGDDTGDPLLLPVREIAERFVELYWRQVAPWPGAGKDGVLAQNTGRQAAIVRTVREAREMYGHRLDRVRRQPDRWGGLTAEVDRIVRVMPLWRLQTVGRDTHEFLYRNRVLEGSGRDAAIRLLPGVSYCFRTFHGLVVDLVRGAWMRFVRRLNPQALGEVNELGEFLFGAPRASLQALREPLVELQQGGCFYCQRSIEAGGAHVDHFIPWARYPVDLGHNFVLAHDRCNGNKGDHLADARHLARWTARNSALGYELGLALESAGIPHDLASSQRVARWAYRQVADRQGLVWVRGRELVPLDDSWVTHWPGGAGAPAF